MAGEVFGIGSQLKDVLPSDLQAVRMALGTGVHFSFSLLFWIINIGLSVFSRAFYVVI